MYTLILNSKKRANKENTTTSDCEYNFDWGVIPEGKYKVTYSLSKGLNLLSPLQKLLANKIPYAKYNGASYVNNRLIDESGNNRNAICSGVSTVMTPALNGSSISFLAAKGIAIAKGSSYIDFGAGSIPTNFTICSLTRYSTTTSQFRILASKDSNHIFATMRDELV